MKQQIGFYKLRETDSPFSVRFFWAKYLFKLVKRKTLKRGVLPKIKPKTHRYLATLVDFSP